MLFLLLSFSLDDDELLEYDRDLRLSLFDFLALGDGERFLSSSLACLLLSGDGDRDFFSGDGLASHLLFLLLSFSLLMTIPLCFLAATFPLSSLELPLEDGGGTGGDGAPGLVGRLSIWLSTGGDRLGGVVSSFF